MVLHTRSYMNIREWSLQTLCDFKVRILHNSLLQNWVKMVFIQLHYLLPIFPTPFLSCLISAANHCIQVCRLQPLACSSVVYIQLCLLVHSVVIAYILWVGTNQMWCIYVWSHSVTLHILCIVQLYSRHTFRRYLFICTNISALICKI